MCNRREALLKTRERRKTQNCRVFEVKIDKSHLSKEKRKYLNRIFLEAKWLHNYALATENLLNFDTKTKEVVVLNKDRLPENRKIEYLSSQMRQELVSRMLDSTKGLAKTRKNGRKIGRLKFKSEINSIPLKQFGVTYRIENDKYIKLQGFKKHFKVLGLNQFPQKAEIANANLICHSGNYFLKVTCFVPKEDRKHTGKTIGFDFGIKNCITASDGAIYNFKFPESKQTKKAAKRMSKKEKGSKSRFRAKMKLRKQYRKTKNRKNDRVKKFLSKVKKNYDVICIQDENINGWHSSSLKGHGRKVQQSAMGGIISELKNLSETTVVDRFFPSTKLCLGCGKLNSPKLDNRVYFCECGYSCDRDIHSARNILKEGLRIKSACGTQSRNACGESVSATANNLVEARSLYALA